MAIPADLLALLEARYRFLKYLLEIDTTPEFRICSGMYSFSYGGNSFTPRGWKPGQITFGDPRRAGFTMTIEDIDGEIEARAYSEGWTGKTATLYIMGRKDDGTWAAAWEPVTAIISDVSGGHVFANLKAIGGVGLVSRAGLQEGDSYCRLVYKGARCKYAGPELTCPRTFAACSTRSAGDNSANFRGARYAPEPGTVIPLGPAGATIPQAPPMTQWFPNNWPPDDRQERAIDPSADPISVDGGGPPSDPGGSGGQSQAQNPGGSSAVNS